MSSKPVHVESLEPGAESVAESVAGESAGATPAPRPGMSPALARRLRWILPLAVGALTGLIVSLIFVTSPSPTRVVREVPAPPVRILTVQPQALTLTVTTQGSVAPRTRSDLVAEVAGRVVWVSPRLVAGGFVSKGEELLR